MMRSLNENKIAQFSEFLTEKTGLSFPADQQHYLEQKIFSAAKEFAFDDAEEFIDWLIHRQLTMNEMEILTSYLTTTETYFWREGETFNALENEILPSLIQSPLAKEK